MKVHTNRARYNQASFLSHEDERCLIDRWQSRRDPKALDALIEAFGPLINKELARASKNFDLRTRIRSAGSIGIMRALETFEPARELRFGTYAQHWIRRQVKEDSSLELQLVRLPLGRLGRAAEQLSFAGVDTSDSTAIAKAARAAGISESDILLIQGHFGPKLSLNAPSRETGESLEHVIADSRDLEVEATVRQAQVTASSMLGVALTRLNERETDIIRCRITQETAMTLQELAARHGVSPERIRQIEVAALAKLRASIPREKAVAVLEALAA